MAPLITSTPPTEPISHSTRLLAAVAIALVSLGITWLAHRWIQGDTDVVIVPLYYGE